MWKIWKVAKLGVFHMKGFTHRSVYLCSTVALQCVLTVATTMRSFPADFLPSLWPTHVRRLCKSCFLYDDGPDLCRYAALVAAMRSEMPRTRILLMGLLPQAALYTLPAYPGDLFLNLTAPWPATYDQGGKAVTPSSEMSRMRSCLACTIRTFIPIWQPHIGSNPNDDRAPGSDFVRLCTDHSSKSCVPVRHPQAVVTEMRILCVAAKWGPDILFCMPPGTLLVSVMCVALLLSVSAMLW
jgi:hypothetical protein